MDNIYYIAILNFKEWFQKIMASKIYLEVYKNLGE